MHTLTGAVRYYGWGSRTVIAELQNRPTPSPEPEAELWFGAHPGAPSGIDGDRRTLLELINTAPVSALGPESAAAFGGRLPFLVKILAAQEPLSLQAHPSAEQARAGFAAENDAGLDLDDPRRNYRDDSAKPEIVVALTDFVALAGFRETPATVEFLRFLDAGLFAAAIEALTAHPGETGIRRVFTDWLRMARGPMAELQRAVLQRAEALAGEPSVYECELQTLLALGEKYPDDPGVIASLLLNVVNLRPGEALFLPAGSLHAYVCGAAVEAMASSDNVLRGGLTSKHVDVDELLCVLDFSPVDPGRLAPRVSRCGSEHRYLTPAAEFALSRFHLLNPAERTPIDSDGPQILIVVDGTIEVVTGPGLPRRVSRGQGLWLSHNDVAVSVRPVGGPAVVFRCRTGRIGQPASLRRRSTTGFAL
ncbi:mannose-6-phosphate isomerase, class I [Gordonia iterans]